MKIYQIKFPEDKDVKYESFTYPAGESQVRLNGEEIEKVSQADEVHLTARINSSSHLLEFLLLSDALEKLARDAKRLVLILPYLPYSRADRRFTDGDCLGLKVCGKLLNDLGFDLIVTVDAHSPKAHKYISNLLDVSPLEFIKDSLEALPKETAILLPDAGAKRYGLEKEFNHVFYGEKKRNQLTGKILGFKIPEEINDFKNILIVDDICDGGGTFIGIAQELFISSNAHLYLYVTHGIFSKGVDPLLEYFNGIFTTDSFTTETNRVVKYPVGGLVNSHLLSTSDIYQLASEE